MKKVVFLIAVFLIFTSFILSLVNAGSFGYNYLEHPNSFFGEVEFDGGWLDGGCTIEDGEIHCQKGFFYNLTSVDVTKQNMTILDNLEIDGNITANWFNGLWNGSSDYLLTSNWNATNTSYSPHQSGTSAGQMAFWDGTKWVKTETSELFWDDVNKRLGIGMSNPLEPLCIAGRERIQSQSGRIMFGDAGYNPVIKFYKWTGGSTNFYNWHIMITDNFEILAGDSGAIGSESVTAKFTILNNGNIGIGTTTPSFPLEVRGNSTNNVSIWAWGNMSATGFITRTSIFDKTKNVWDYIKDADYFKINNKIEHKNFYGYAGEFEVTDYSRPETKVRCFKITKLENYTHTEEVCEYRKRLLSDDYEYICENVSEQKERNIQNCSMQEQCNYIQKEGEEFFEKVCEIVEVCTDTFFEVYEDEITYPHKKTEEGVELGMEIDVLRQAVFELNERVKYLESK